MSDSAVRQLPGLQADNRPFWTGGAQGQLLISRCRDCATYLHPPLPRCAACGSSHVLPEPVSGQGRVASFTVNHQRWVPGLATPYVFAAVELAEQAGLHVFSNVVGCPVDSVSIGMAVAVCFEVHDDIYLPIFQPAVAA